VDQSRPGLRAAGVERNRHEIVATGRRHLIETGYHRLSLERVAEGAGVTRVTIYRQFGSKLGLLVAVADDLAVRAQIAGGLMSAASNEDPALAFRLMVAELCRFWGTDPELLRRLVSLAAVDPEVSLEIATREQWRDDQMVSVVHRLASEDRLRAAFDLDHAVAVIGAVTGFPACDEMVTRLHMDFIELDALLLTLLGSVLDLA
jgi:AcrR family transcriptional regulator